MERIRLGISACLLGENVRYDGGHKLDRYLRDTLGQFVDYVPVCPESECGLGIPREAMRLVGEPAAPRLVTVKTGVDHTERMLEWASRRVTELEAENLCGFIFKSRSPSSGMERVKVYPPQGMPTHAGVGMFARVFMAHFPLLPVEEEGRLQDPALRENFIERVFTLKRWRDMLADGPSLARLVEFHTRHKLLLLAHSPRDYTELGRWVANAKRRPFPAVLEDYQARLMTALRLRATARKNTNVLQHIYIRSAVAEALHVSIPR
ncbi:MAG: hypothetical protein A3K19_26865 [Lentisphaerae bacterium RIFOXYB12_FULL_65_16]|nr:MAG: hypothetical protein A3K18_23840 [Lentisphaerae bacterium RIFOXYA12_64_32]OGV88021.1 MAG: hypothetical protein A3K19_26865 [Lentisphaerae bacterium RIFOXYB12_FULL_65_16]